MRSSCIFPIEMTAQTSDMSEVEVGYRHAEATEALRRMAETNAKSIKARATRCRWIGPMDASGREYDKADSRTTEKAEV